MEVLGVPPVTRRPKLEIPLNSISEELLEQK
jgi:hypothetical protein